MLSLPLSSVSFDIKYLRHCLTSLYYIYIYILFIQSFIILDRKSVKLTVNFFERTQLCYNKGETNYHYYAFRPPVINNSPKYKKKERKTYTKSKYNKTLNYIKIRKEFCRC